MEDLFSYELHLFIFFCIFIVLFLLIDLGILNKKAHRISPKAAFFQTIFWIIVSITFGIIIGKDLPSDVGNIKMWEYFTAYATEKSLSIDNIFVIILILKYFKIEEIYHHKILFWGIIGALLFRGIFIGLGVELVKSAGFVLHIFGAVLLFSGIKLFISKKEEEFNPENSHVITLCKKFLHISKSNYGGRFIKRENGILFFTPLFMVLLLIETTDVIFAFDSIPAAFGVTQDPFILYTSNIFAILGLRAMFFLLQGILQRFYLLQKGLSLILIFIGGKMIAKLSYIEENIAFIKKTNLFFESAPHWSFIVIFSILMCSIIFSIIFKEKKY